MPEVKNVRVKEITKVKEKEDDVVPMFPIKRSSWLYPDGAVRIKYGIEEREYRRALSAGIKITPLEVV